MISRQPNGLFTVNGVPNLTLNEARQRSGQNIQISQYPIPGTPPIIPADEDPMDLGDIYTGVDDLLFGGMLPGGATPGFLSGSPGGVPATTGSPPVTVTANPGFVNPTGHPTGPAPGYVFDPSANCGQGKWIKKRRKRRRPIVTEAECGQISMLAGSVGKGATFREILAKRMRC